MAKRKTIEVKTLVENANLLLSRPDAPDLDGDPHINKQFRLGVIAMVERVLHDTGNYRGFAYLSSELTTADQPHVLNTTYLRIGYDDTRRRYYLPREN